VAGSPTVAVEFRTDRWLTARLDGLLVIDSAHPAPVSRLQGRKQ